MRRGLASALVVLLVVSVLVAACAQAPSSPAPSTPTKAPEAAKPVSQAKEPAETTPIKIGYLVPLTGGAAAMGADMRDGFALYLSEKGGSLAGRKVELIVEDEENPQVGLTKAKKLVERDGVHMLAGVNNSGVAYALADYVKGQKIPLIINNAGADDLTQRQFNPYILRTSFSSSQMVYPLGEWAYKKGYRKASVLASDFAAGYEYVGGFARTFIGAGGKIVQEQYPALGSADPAPFITSIKPDADVVFTFLIGAEALRFVKVYEQYGLKNRVPLLGVASMTDDALLPAEGDSALGIVTSGYWTAALDTPANKAFIAAFEKKYNRQVTLGAAEGYEGAMVVEKALLATKGNVEDKEAFIKALEKVEIPDTPRGPVKFDRYHNPVVNVYITEVKKVDGKLVNSVVETSKEVSQFWKSTPEEYLKQPPYPDLKGTWAK